MTLRAGRRCGLMDEALGRSGSLVRCSRTWTSTRITEHAILEITNKIHKDHHIFHVNKIEMARFIQASTMPITIKMLDGTTKEATPRPTVNVDEACCSATTKQRKEALRKRIRISHALTRQMWIYRELQWHLMQTAKKCTKKQAKVWSDDPDPYEKSYVFYCVNSGVSL